MYAKVSLQTLSGWWTYQLVKGGTPSLQRFLKEYGAETISEKRSFAGMVSGWVEVPQGSCIRLRLGNDIHELL
jgi:hypothetical protein